MSFTIPLTIPVGLPHRPDDLREKSFRRKSFPDTKFLGGYLKECSLIRSISADCSLDDCAVYECVLTNVDGFSATYEGHKLAFQNTILIGSRIRKAVLQNCLIIQCHLEACTLVNCRITQITGLERDLGMLTKEDLFHSKWAKDLDIFPPEEFYLSTDEARRQHCLEIWHLDSFPAILGDCKVRGSLLENIQITASKIHGGSSTGCSFHTSVLMHLATDKCNLNYSDVRRSWLKECTIVRSIITACTEDGKVIKYRPSGVSLTTLPAEIRMRIFKYAIGYANGDNVGLKTPNLICALRVESNLYQEALEAFANNYFFRFTLPEDLDRIKVPFEWVRHLSLPCWTLSLPGKDKYPYFPALIDLHMSILVMGEQQVAEDFQVMIDFARKHNLKRLSIAYRCSLAYKRFSRKPLLKSSAGKIIQQILAALTVKPLLEDMKSLKANGYYLAGEPKVSIGRQDSSQYTWTCVAEKGFLTWKE